EMLEGCLRHPDRWAWYAAWLLERKDGTRIGDLCFKGLGEDGSAELGYGILEAYQGQGFATEAVLALCRWAFSHPEVTRLEAETEAENAASQRVLKKCGFRPTGHMGAEGPRFVLSRNNLPTLRPYREADYEALCTFLIELNRAEKTHIHWNWARLEWMMEHPEFDRRSRSAIGLWWAEGRIVGAAIYDMYFGEAFCGALEDFSWLYPALLRYAFQTLRDSSGLGIAICDGCKQETEAALAAGFAPVEQRETVLKMDLNFLPSLLLPEGFTLAELDPTEEPVEFQWLLWQGFDHGSDYAQFEREVQTAPPLRPHFNRHLSLTALGADGARVAYCCLWFHPETDYAYVEPVCTIPAFRGKGIGAALLTEALARAKNLGAREAYVISDLPFYKKLGFSEEQLYTFYWKVR
ncbi:MAG: GNAT family N-acetyltransferase, partial [bacterium]